MTRPNLLRTLWLAAGSLLLAAAASSALAAPAPRVVGARTFDAGAMGLWVSAGVPDVELGARWGVSSVADLGPRLRLSYGTGSHLGGFGSSAALVARLRLAALAGWDVALTAEPGAFVHAGVDDWAPLAKAGKRGATTALLGVDLGVPGLVASTQLAGDWLAAVTLAAPVQIHLSPEPTVAWQVLARLQALKAVDRHWSALAGGEWGTAFYGPGAGAAAAEPLWRLYVGVSWQ